MRAKASSSSSRFVKPNRLDRLELERDLRLPMEVARRFPREVVVLPRLDQAVDLVVHLPLGVDLLDVVAYRALPSSNRRKKPSLGAPQDVLG